MLIEWASEILIIKNKMGIMINILKITILKKMFITPL